MRTDALPRVHSIGARLTLLYMFVALVTVAIFAGITDWRLSVNFAAEHRRFVQTKAAELQADLNDAGGDPAALLDEIVKETAGSKLRQYQARVLNREGRMLGETPGMQRELPASTFSQGSSGSPSATLQLRHVGDHGYALSTLMLRDPNGMVAATVQLAVDVTHDEALQSDLRRALAFTFLLLVPLLALAGRWVAAKGLAPLQRISGAARSITPANLTARLPLLPRWPDELHELVQVFNAMLARMEEAFARLSRFSADLAHELRTPLGNLSGELEVCLMRPRTAQDYRAALESGLDECRRLNVLIENLLFMARAEHAEQALHREHFCAEQVCAWVIEQQVPGAAARGVVIRQQGEAIMQADPLLFRQALANLLSNAIRHSRAGGEVEIRLATVAEGVKICVQDHGEGIEAQHLAHLFDRFYQIDPARQHGTGQGTGLGLSIVQAIVELHHGVVRVDSVPDAGTTATMYFPRNAVHVPPAADELS
ncbi:MAG: heavy metal sensor histidine kinase [Rhodanobacter sp.]|jgi:two-component system heavy metal sensor histidine kinase CusS